MKSLVMRCMTEKKEGGTKEKKKQKKISATGSSDARHHMPSEDGRFLMDIKTNS